MDIRGVTRPGTAAIPAMCVATAGLSLAMRPVYAVDFYSGPALVQNCLSITWSAGCR